MAKKKGKTKEDNSLAVKFNDISNFAGKTAKIPKQNDKFYRNKLSRSLSSGDDRQAALVYFGWIPSLIDKGDYAKPEELLAAAREKFGEYLDLYFLRLLLYVNSENYKKAIESGREYLDLHKNTDPAKNDHLNQSFTYYCDALWLASEAARRTANFNESLDYQKKAMEIEPQNHYRRIILASNLGKDGKIDDAIAILDDGLVKYPREMAFENAKALVYGDAEKFDKAEEVVTGLLKKNKNDIDAMINFGVILEKKGDYDRAESFFKNALKVDPKHDVARENLENLKKTIDDKPQKISLCMIVKNEEKFLPQCLKTVNGLYDELIVVDTGSTDRTMEIAAEFGGKIYQHPWENDFSLHRNQSIDYATGDWILILDADEELDPAEHGMIRSVIKRRDIDAVSFVVYNKIQGGRTGFLNSHRMFKNKNEYRYSGIVHNQLVMDGITLSSQLKVFHHGYGLSEEKMKAKGRRTEALLKKQLEENPDNAFAHFNLAQIYRGLSEPEQCLEHAQKVIDILDPENLDRRHVYVMALDQIGCAYVGLEDNEKAKEAFYKALELKDDYLDPLFNLGYVYSKESDYDKADELFLRYLVVRDNFSEHREWMGLILNNLSSQFAVYYGLGLSQYFRNNIDKALEYFHKVIDEVGDFEFTQHLIARCYRHKKEFDKVIVHCNQAIKNDHEDSEIYILLGEAYLNTGEHKKATECFEKSSTFGGPSDAALLGLAGAASLEGDRNKAMEAIEKALKLTPNSPQALASKGDLLYDFNNFSSAAESYRNQTRANANDPSPWNNLGNCLLKQNNYASAEEYYRKSLEISPDFALGYRNLAVSLLKQDRLDESVAYFEKYLQNNPLDSGISATLGDIYYKLKDYWKAISHYENYLGKKPNQFSAILRMSDCYFNLNKLDSAKLGYQAVLKMDPDNSMAEQRLGELNEFNQAVDTQ
ncbi:MAG: tetratricopeptide repeat protein [candidate division Zixibacteria bacterium]